MSGFCAIGTQTRWLFFPSKICCAFRCCCCCCLHLIVCFRFPVFQFFHKKPIENWALIANVLSFFHRMQNSEHLADFCQSRGTKFELDKIEPFFFSVFNLNAVRVVVANGWELGERGDCSFINRFWKDFVHLCSIAENNGGYNLSDKNLVEIENIETGRWYIRGSNEYFQEEKQLSKHQNQRPYRSSCCIEQFSAHLHVQFCWNDLWKCSIKQLLICCIMCPPATIVIIQHWIITR